MQNEILDQQILETEAMRDRAERDRDAKYEQIRSALESRNNELESAIDRAMIEVIFFFSRHFMFSFVCTKKIWPRKSRRLIILEYR